MRGLRGWVLPLLLLALWVVATRKAWVSPVVLVPPAQVIAALGDPIVKAHLAGALVGSVRRMVEGAGFGIAVGLAFGTVLALSRRADRLMGPTFHAFRQIAVFAWSPLLTAWFGNGETSKIVFIGLAAFYPTVMGTYQGIRDVKPALLEVGDVLCFPPTLRLRRILLPAALPAIAASLQLALLFSWLAAIGAEYLMGGLTQGVGAFVITGREQLRTDLVLVGIVCIAILGFALNALLRLSVRRLSRWRQA